MRAQETKTERRFRKPMRKNMWTHIHVNHANNPLQFARKGQRILATAAFRPIVRNVTFIEVTEAGKVLDDLWSLHKVLNASSRVYTHLHCRLRYTGDRSAILLQICGDRHRQRRLANL